MKKFYIIAVAAALCAGNAVAQDKPQLPNADFEGAWNDCVPWTSNGNTKTMGKTPADWCIAQVIGMSGTGKTLVGVKDTGYNGEGSCVKVVNSNNSTKKTQVVPGYVTLGTTWSTAKGLTGSNPDGGTFGGIVFTGRPESVTFVYKRVHGTTNADGSAIYSNTGNTEEKATVVAYLWKGEYVQANVPGCISLASPKTVNMVNRDRNILDMKTAQGKDVTKKGTLIGKINYDITGNAEDWTELTIPFEYLTDDTPEKFNIIFCAGDYFSTTPGAGNALYIDNVKLNYPAAVVDTKKYVGTLSVQLGNEDPAVSDQDVYMDQLNDGKYRLRLENFGADPTIPDDKGMGSIVVLCTIDNGVVSGHADGISLMEGEITANADVTGTLDGSKLQLNIDVVYLDMPDMPIKVTFNGEVKTDGISDIEIDSNVAPVYYNLQGVRIANPENGLFIEVRGNKAVKVIK